MAQPLGEGTVIGFERADAASPHAVSPGVDVLWNPGMPVLAGRFEDAVKSTPVVLLASDRLKVRRTDAVPNAAEVVEVSRWQNPIGVLVGHPMHLLHATFIATQNGVSLVKRAFPQPTGAKVGTEGGHGSVFVDMCPDTLNQWAMALLLKWFVCQHIAIESLADVVGVTKTALHRSRWISAVRHIAVRSHVPSVAQCYGLMRCYYRS